MQSSHSRWLAISQRDPAAHCLFLYGVKSTKIYCRPTCTARLARRANVIYFETADQAQRDGYRPCQKCKPDDLGFVGQREQTVLSALDLLRVRKDDTTFQWSLKELAKEVGVTPSYLCRAFKKTMGSTIGEYMKQFEMQENGSATKNTSESPQLAGLKTDGLRRVSKHQTTTTWSSPDTEGSVKAVSTNGAHVASGQTPRISTVSSGTPEENSPSAPTEPSCRLPSCDEEDLDLDFDFDEWVWTEGLPVTTGF